MSADDESWKRVKELVADALELPPERRHAFLDDLEAEAPEVSERVKHLVNAVEESGDPLEQAAEEPRVITARPVDWTGKSLGGYAVKRFVARGGMGEVYEAVQESTGRRVALKLLSGGSSGDSPGVWRTRFRHEIGILARLEHPAVAQILDADVEVDADGREWPYLALEYVEGEPLIAFAEARDLPVERRIELLIEVCAGVQHAHQRGVIHRDLKPENILVADTVDGGAQPKVLDFGVARVFADGEGRAGGERDKPPTHLTRAGELIGTLSYMSPEQVLGLPDAVDTRTDVHALGVLLFQLLTGRLPIDLAGVPLPEAVRRLRESEPAAPSAVDPALRGDLDTICATAMARDCEARYASVSELAADLGRYLRREPIAARPASRFYHLKMFARRNRGLVAGLVLAALVLLIGSGTTTVGLMQAREEARRTRDANRFLGEILSAVDPEMLGKDVTVREVLDLNAPRIDAVFASDERTRAELHATVGWTYFNLGEYERARAHLGDALTLYRALDGADSENALSTRRLLQIVTLEFDAASDGALAEARELVEQTAAALGPAHADSLGARVGLAHVLAGRGEYEQALEIARAAYNEAVRALGRDQDMTSTLGSDLGALLMGAGKYEEAARLLEDIYAERVERHGASHPRTIKALINLATADSLAHRSEKALAAFDRGLEDARGAWDERHPTMLLLRGNRANALSGLGRYEEAIEAYREVYDLSCEVLGKDAASTLSDLFNLGVNQTYAERFAEAEATARALLEGAERCDGCEDDFLMRAMGLLASVLGELGRLEEAVPLTRRALDEHRRVLGPGHFQTLIQANNLARTLAEVERYGESIELFEETLATWLVEYPEVISVERTFRWNYARTLAEARRDDDAEAEFLRVQELAVDAGPNPRPTPEEVLERMAELYDTAERPADAEACRSELATLRGTP